MPKAKKVAIASRGPSKSVLDVNEDAPMQACSNTQVENM